jgi:protein involved in polysaccharide export with SLBB domain
LSLSNYKFLFVLCVLLSGCSYVLDEPELSSVKGKENQEEIEVDIRPLTSETVNALNNEQFSKKLVVPSLDKYKLTHDKLDFQIVRPRTTKPIAYKIGIGDLIELTTIRNRTSNTPSSATGSPDVLLGITTPSALINNTRAQEVISKTSSRVSADGSILFIETGRLEVQNKTTAEVRAMVTDALIRNGNDTRFQLEVIEFNSQTVSLVSYNSPVNNLNSDTQIGAALFPITERPTTLRELLVGAGLILKKDVIELVTLQRGQELYQLTLKLLFNPTTPEYYLQGGDIITVEAFKYKQEHAFVLGGRSTPFLINLSEDNPVPLANALFTEAGVLASTASKKSEVYLLRGKNPVVAYHLDATDAARLTLSAELELRPNDIIFASTVRIVDFNTVLGLLNPLRILTGQEQPLFSPAF